MFPCKLHQQRLIYTGSPEAWGPLPQRGSSASSHQPAQGFTQLSYQTPSDRDRHPPLGLGLTQLFCWEINQLFLTSILSLCNVILCCCLSHSHHVLLGKSTAAPPSSLPVVLRMLLYAPTAIPSLSWSSARATISPHREKTPASLAAPQLLRVIFSVFLKY